VAFHQEVVEVGTSGPGPYDVTAQVAAVVARAGFGTGLVSVFIQHTSASLLIQENADPAVLRDLTQFLADVAPESRAWEHDDEGPDDMPAHVKSALTQTEQTMPVRYGKLALGTWQGLYVLEHRSRAHRRVLVVTVWGE
jgi:secondary thiamine-phosphate synthase enzyme